MTIPLGKALIVPVAGIVAALTACSVPSDPNIKGCEALLLPTLKAPSTYKLIDSTVSLPRKDGSRDVFLNYDAANVYNTPIRDIFVCTVGADGTAKVKEITADILDSAEAAIDRTMPTSAPSSSKQPPADASTPMAEPSFSDDDEVPVCDRPDTPEKVALMNEIGVDCAPD